MNIRLPTKKVGMPLMPYCRASRYWAMTVCECSPCSRLRPHIITVEANLFAYRHQRLNLADVLPVIPEGLVGGVVEFDEFALLLGVLRSFQGVERVGGVRRGSHDQTGLPRLPAQRLRQLVSGLSRAGGTFSAFPRSVGPQQIGLAFDLDIEFLGQVVDPLQADIAPRSNIVVPDGHLDRGVVMFTVVGFLCHSGPPDD